MDKVSVIIPTWNRENTIPKAINSALNQTYPCHEVLVCDDGSTDNTRKLVQAIGDSRVKWLPGPHSGLPAIPRNRGIKTAKGEWLAFLDSDDYWMPEKLENQLAFAEKHNSLAACSNALRFIPDKGNVGAYFQCQSGRITFKDLLRINRVISSSVVIHKSLLETVEGFSEATELKANEDYALWLRITTLTDFAFLGEPLVCYRDCPTESVRQEPLTVQEQRLRIFSDFMDWCKRHSIPVKYRFPAQFNFLWADDLSWTQRLACLARYVVHRLGFGGMRDDNES